MDNKELCFTTDVVDGFTPLVSELTDLLERFPDRFLKIKDVFINNCGDTFSKFACVNQVTTSALTVRVEGSDLFHDLLSALRADCVDAFILKHGHEFFS